MAFCGRPKKHDSRADDIRKAICSSKIDELMGIMNSVDLNILDGEGRTPLINSIINENFEIVQWLFTQGVDVNIQDRAGLSALHFSVQNKNLELCKSLLQKKASIDLKDTYGNTPLWKATFDARGDYNIVKVLVSKGADVNSKNNAGRSPIDFAMQIKDDDLLKILMDG